MQNTLRYATVSLIMKKDIHPDNHRLVIFHDTSSGKRFLAGSTIATEETDKWDDGKEYPLYKVEISSASHPFYTGERKEMDTAGRADKFRKRMAKAKTSRGAQSAPSSEQSTEKAESLQEA